MKVDISLSASTSDIREYNAPSEYRTKADAKAAVACMAVQQGVIELLRFRGEPPPADYTPFLAARSSEMSNNQRFSNKRKEPDEDDYAEGPAESQDRKKRKKNNKGGRNTQGNPGYPMEAVMAGRPIHALPRRPPDAASGIGNRNSSNNGSWMKPHVFGSSGLGSIGGSAQPGRSMSQFRPGPRNGGDSTSPNEGVPQVGQVANAIVRAPMADNRRSNPMPNGRLGYGGGHTVPYQFAPHPVSEPFSGPSFPSYLNHPASGNFAGGAASYPPPQYIGPHAPAPLPETHATQMSYGPYQPAQFQQHPHPGASANYPPHPQVIYAAGPAPVVTAANVYHPTNYVPEYSGTHPQPYISQTLPPQFLPNSSHSGQNFHNPRGSHSHDRPPTKRQRSPDYDRGHSGEGFTKRSKNARQDSGRGPRFHNRKRQRERGPSSTCDLHGLSECSRKDYL